MGIFKHLFWIAPMAMVGWQRDVVKLVEFLRYNLPFSITKDLFRHVLLNLLSNVIS